MLVSAGVAIAAQSTELLCRESGGGSEADDMARKRRRKWENDETQHNEERGSQVMNPLLILVCLNFEVRRNGEPWRTSAV